MSNNKLYADEHPKTSTKGTGYKDKKKALDTLKIIKNFDKNKQVQIIITMYNRAKFHPNQTKSMREAMKIFKLWLEKRGYKS